VVDSVWGFHKNYVLVLFLFLCFSPQNSQSSIVIDSLFLITIMAIIKNEVIYNFHS